MTQYSWGSNKYLNIFQTTITWIFGFKTKREGPTVHWKPVPDWVMTIRASRGHERSGGLQREYQEEEEGKERGRKEHGRRGKELERAGKVSVWPCRAWVTEEGMSTSLLPTHLLQAKAWHRCISGKAVGKEGAEDTESSRPSNQS